jgi:hypothetical protein
MFLKWLPLIITILTLLVSGVLQYATTGAHVNQLMIDVNSHNSRISFLEGERGKLNTIEERVNWAATRADDAKKLGDSLLDDRLSSCRGSK